MRSLPSADSLHRRSTAGSSRLSPNDPFAGAARQSLPASAVRTTVGPQTAAACACILGGFSHAIESAHKSDGTMFSLEQLTVIVTEHPVYP
jgi:hypothetical protein